ncbi:MULTISPECIES: SDR family oxidoreductase [unclassified Nocardioides]|uniref:SDR family oxidoreductase n=1 Tax=unclassified Nocardioides TaxID=2615069 RepID=UPI0030150361
MSTRTVAITGAAAGIGRATALAFAERGWAVTAYDVDGAGLASLPATVRTGTLDVTDPDAFVAALADLVAEHGRLDVLVNNAGLLRSGPFAEQDLGALRQEVAVNVTGVLHGMHAAFPHLRATAAAHGSAVVVNLSSASAIYGQAELANYSATKFYVRGLTEALELEWRRHGIRVTDLWPLFVRTGMLDGVRTGTTDSLGIHLAAEDVAAAVLAAVDPPRLHRLTRRVHVPVGRQAGAMLLGSRFSPAWLTRAINRRLAHS